MLSSGSEYPAETNPSLHRPIAATALDSNPSNTLMLDRVKILVVDDESDERGLLKTLLELYGARVITADSGLEGVRQFIAHQPEVLISDISLLDFNGYELLRRIRALERSQRSAVGDLAAADAASQVATHGAPLKAASPIPAIAISGYGGEQRRMQALRVGFTEYITKPCNPGELLAIMASIMRRKAQYTS